MASTFKITGNKGTLEEQLKAIDEQTKAAKEELRKRYNKKIKELELRKLGTFEQDTGGQVDVYVDEDGLLTI